MISSLTQGAATLGSDLLCAAHPSARYTTHPGSMFNLAAGGGNVQGYNAEFTWVSFLCCLIAASGGALFGYDNGECFLLQGTFNFSSVGML